MEINYDNAQVEKLFRDLNDVKNSRNLLQKKIGKEKAIATKKRKNQIEASTNFQAYLDLHIGNPHSLTGNLASCYAVDINAHIRLIIKPISNDLSAESLKLCTSVIIRGIMEYHGGKDEWIIP